MRIAVFSEVYWPMVSGVSATLRRLTDAMHARGHQVRVYTADYPLPADTPDRPEVHRSPSKSFFLSPQIQWAFPRLPEIVADLRRFDADIVHLATEFAMGYPGLRAARALRLPLIASAHTDYERYASRYGKWLLPVVKPGWKYLQWFYGHAHRVLCPSRIFERHLNNRGIRHTGIWSRGVNAHEFSPAHRSEAWRARFGVGPGDPLVAYVGRVAPEKNLPLLLEAWAQLGSARGGAQLVIVGEGVLSESLARQKPEGVHLIGFKHGADLAMAYASCDIFAFPSTTETFGNVLLEAMASGCAPVVAAAGGVLDFATHGSNALLARPESVASFAEELGRLLQEEPLRRRLSSGARATALARDWDTIFDTLLDDYRAAIAAHPRQRLAA
ncbi:MAG: glycosyltransferase family 1 protein [Gemmatimonadales bacterium]|nr:glycosyltransferase family 1 protein [Gemmatimonadales bacterium]